MYSEMEHPGDLLLGLQRDSFGLFASEFFKPLDDDVAIRRIEFHEKRVSARLLGGDQRGARAPEQIEDVFTGKR